MLRDLKKNAFSGPGAGRIRMTKKMLGGALVGAAMAVAGCAGGPGTSADPTALDQSVVPSTVNGRTDLFLDPTLSTHLLTADEVNGSPTAVQVAVEITSSELIAWRASVPAASRTSGDMVGHFPILGAVDLTTATPIGDETHEPGSTGAVLPPGQSQLLRGGSTTGPSGGSLPRLLRIPTIGFTVQWSTDHGIPNAVDANALHNIVAAHPGCA
jgi:hypothetical protein